MLPPPLKQQEQQNNDIILPRTCCSGRSTCRRASRSTSTGLTCRRGSGRAFYGPRSASGWPSAPRPKRRRRRRRRRARGWRRGALTGSADGAPPLLRRRSAAPTGRPLLPGQLSPMRRRPRSWWTTVTGLATLQLGRRPRAQLEARAFLRRRKSRPRTGGAGLFCAGFPATSWSPPSHGFETRAQNMMGLGEPVQKRARARERGSGSARKRVMRKVGAAA